MHFILCQHNSQENRPTLSPSGHMKHEQTSFEQYSYMYDFHHNILILKTTSAEAWTTITITIPKNSLRQVKVKSFEEKEPYVYFLNKMSSEHTQ